MNIQVFYFFAIFIVLVGSSGCVALLAPTPWKCSEGKD